MAKENTSTSDGTAKTSKVKDENYIHIPGWAVTRLGLKGNELLVYSIIYGFSQDGETRFTGSLQYLADWTNSTKQGCIKCLKSLVKEGYVVKYEKVVNGVKFCEYQGVKPRFMVLNKVDRGIKQSLIGGIKQSLPNNIDIDNIDNNIDNVINTNVLITGDDVASETINESNSQKATKPTYGNSDINGMFDFWQETVGTPIISREKSNRRACYNLLRNKHIGEEKLRHAVEFVGDIKEDRFAPRISDFVDLQSKFNELCAYKTKYKAQQDVSGDKTPNRAVSSAMKGNNSAGGNVEFVPWRPTAGDLEREREWNEKERRQTEESAKVDPEWLEELKQETIRKIYNHGDNK